MKLLLPPSEGKAFGKNPASLNLELLSFPELLAARKAMLSALIRTSKSKTALQTLGLTAGLATEVEQNRALESAPTAPAIEIYEGVVFQNLDYHSLAASARTRADAQIVITSALFGFVQPQDLIPHYRLSGSVTLPRVGGIASFWKSHTAELFRESEFIVDLRSGTYEKFWKPEDPNKYLRIKVMQKSAAGDQKLAVSHFNKATKGLIARELCRTSKKIDSTELAIAAIEKAGWEVELVKNQGVFTLEVLMR